MEIDPSTPDENVAIDSKTQQRYRIFKKNAPFLYDYLFTSPLVWPSLTVQFFPDLELQQPANSDPGATNGISQRLLSGTFTSGQAIDAISIDLFTHYHQLNLNINIDQWTYNLEKQEFELTTVPKTKLATLQIINHDGDVNKLAYMPQNPDVIASVNNTGDLLIYNRTKHSAIKKVTSNEKANTPQLRLIGEYDDSNAEIFAVDWNKQKEGLIVSGNMKGLLNVHDIRQGYDNRDNESLRPFWSRKDSHGINDVEWIPDHDSVFVCGDEYGVLSLTDTRSGNEPKTKHRTGSAINSISVNPSDSFCLASGNSEGIIELWDLRNLNTSVSQTCMHIDAITQLKWHPKYKSVLGSASADRLVKIFNVASVDDPLLFSHEGHMLGVNDFDWSKHVDWMIASVADDNSVHIWLPATHLLPYFS